MNRYPPANKITYSVIIGVVGLHLLAAVGLTHIKPIPVATSIATKPIEITMVNLAKNTSISKPIAISKPNRNQTAPSTIQDNQQALTKKADTPTTITKEIAMDKLSSTQGPKQLTSKPVEVASSKQISALPATSLQQPDIESRPMGDSKRTLDVSPPKSVITKSSLPETMPSDEPFNNIPLGQETDMAKPIIKVPDEVSRQTTSVDNANKTIPVEMNNQPVIQTYTPTLSNQTKPTRANNVKPSTTMSSEQAATQAIESKRDTISNTSMATNQPSHANVTENTLPSYTANRAPSQAANANVNSISNANVATPSTDLAHQPAKNTAPTITKPAKPVNTIPSTATDEPVRFGEGDASWSRNPRVSFPDSVMARAGQTFTVWLKLVVDKQGSIQNVTLAKSSGNIAIDRAAQQQIRTGKFHPFEQQGQPVQGIVNIPLVYKK